MQEALSCPCVDHIKSGPCGASFVGAFTCYLKQQGSEQVRCFACLQRAPAFQWSSMHSDLCTMLESLSCKSAGQADSPDDPAAAAGHSLPGAIQGDAEVHGKAPCSLC